MDQQDTTQRTIPPKTRNASQLERGEESEVTISMEDEATQRNLTRNIQKRKAIHKAFDSQHEEIKELLTNSSSNEEERVTAEAALTEFKILFDQAGELNDEIESLLEGADYETEYERITERRRQDRKVLIAVKNLIEKMNDKTSVLETSVNQQKTVLSAKLPKLRLPNFDGTYTKWSAFWETMESDVLAGNFSDITKFNYIAGQLKGVAEEAVTGIHASGENLQALCLTLKERFGQRRKIVRSHALNLFDISAPSNNYTDLSKFYNQVMGDIRSLNNLNVKTEECAAFLVPLLERKIPRAFIDKMGTSGQEGDFNLKAFLDSFTIHLNNMGERSSSDSKQDPGSAAKGAVGQSSYKDFRSKNAMSAANLVASGSTRNLKCAFCDSSDHTSYHCEPNDTERFQSVRRGRLCFNCLRPHPVKLCNNHRNCSTCKKRHHTALHGYFARQGDANVSVQMCSNSVWQSRVGNMDTILDSVQSSKAIANLSAPQPVSVTAVDTGNQSEFTEYSAPALGLEIHKEGNTATHSANLDTSNNSKIVLLETGRVSLASGNGKAQAGVLIDRGSMLSYIRKDTADKLRLRAHGSRSLNVNGFGGHVSRRCYDLVSVDVITSEGAKSIEVLVTEEIVKPIDQKGWADALRHDYIAELPLADNFAGGQFKVDLLIGCDSAYQFLENRVITSKCGPTVQFSNLGCFLSGPLDVIRHKSVHVTCGASQDVDQSSNDRETVQLEEFLRESVLDCSGFSDTEAEGSFKEDFLEKIQFKEGRYYVPLPWKSDHPELQNNVAACQKRMAQVMGRLGKLNLVNDYVKVMSENIHKGYVSETGRPIDFKDDGFYMPHFPVLRDSATTPVRIVFDASCGSPSLNECLHGGPNMTTDRWLAFDPDEPLHLIVFCDAFPNKAIGCVVYGKQGNKVALLGSKNKVVSQKKVRPTVPQLELQAMVMGAQYAHSLATTFQSQYKTIDSTFLTDSEIALYWLQSDKKLKQFVKNRVELIKNLTKVNQWFHVATSDNSADLLSRGATVQGLLDSDWLAGPAWLKEQSGTWPIRSLSDHSHVTMLAAAVQMENTFSMPVTGNTAGIQEVIDINKFSTYQKLLRVTALVTRAFRVKETDRPRSRINASDISKAEKLWIQNIQHQEYENVFDYLETGKSKRPPIVSQLGLILGDDGLLRCVGRVRQANVDFNRKCPILLHLTSTLRTTQIRFRRCILRYLRVALRAPLN